MKLLIWSISALSSGVAGSASSWRSMSMGNSPYFDVSTT
jgi:hypothetical protein